MTEHASQDLYELLGISRTSDASAVRKAYRRKALVLHPDKHVAATPGDRERITRQFQEVTVAYAILSDDVKRARYDRTGETDDFGFEGGGEDVASLAKYFQELYRGMVTLERIQEYQEKYIGSEEERKDVLESYEKRKGDMGRITADVMFSEVGSEARYLDIINAAIAMGTVQPYPKHATTNTEDCRERRRQKAASEAGDFALTEAKKRKNKRKKSPVVDTGGKWETDDDDANSKEKPTSGGSKTRKRSTARTTRRSDGGAGTEKELSLIGADQHRKRMMELADNLEKKYANKSQSGGRKKKKDGSIPHDPPPPTDEEFEALQAKILKRCGK